MRVLLVDDERLAKRVLGDLLDAHDDVTVVAEAHDVPSAVEALAEHDPDLVFLDVQMPGGSGLDLFHRTEVRARVVFVTAWDAYAVRAFEVHALDYLLKPVDPDRLATALQRARASLPAPPTTALDRRLVDDSVLCAPHRSGMRFFRVADILHIEAADDYVALNLVDGTMLLLPQPLRTWARRLPGSFVQVHRSHIVAVAKVVDVRRAGTSFRVVLEGGSEVQMSRRRAAALRKTFGLS